MLIDGCNDAIEVVDLETSIFWESNQKAFSALGHTRKEFLSMSVYDIAPTVSPQTYVTVRAKLEKSGALITEGVHRKKDGSTFAVEISTTLIELDCSYAVAVARDITQRKAAEDSVRQSVGELLHSQDEEHRRLAGAIQNGIGQNIAGLSLAMGQFQSCVGRADMDSSAILSDCRRLIRATGREVRNVSYLLHPPLIEELGLSFALRWLVTGYEKRNANTASIEIPTDFSRLKPHIELAAFRIVQESLDNICRGSNANIRVMHNPTKLVLEITSVAEERQPTPCVSTKTADPSNLLIQARVHGLNGRFDVKKSPGGEVTMRVELPLR